MPRGASRPPSVRAIRRRCMLPTPLPRAMDCAIRWRSKCSSARGPATCASSWTGARRSTATPTATPRWRSKARTARGASCTHTTRPAERSAACCGGARRRCQACRTSDHARAVSLIVDAKIGRCVGARVLHEDGARASCERRSFCSRPAAPDTSTATRPIRPWPPATAWRWPTAPGRRSPISSSSSSTRRR